MQRLLAPAVLATFACAAPVAAQLAVAATSPARNGVMAPMQSIVATFAQPVDPATVTADAVTAFGRWSGVVTGALSLSADGLMLTLRPDRPLFVGEQVTLTLARTLATPGGQTLAAGHSTHFWVQPAPGSRSFVVDQTIDQRLPGETRTGMYGIYAGDLDRDGSPDITSMNEISNDIRVQYNSGCGAYGPFQVLSNPGQWPSANEGADFDHDGWIDLVTGNQYGGAISVYLNDGQGGLQAPVVMATSGYVHGVAVGDFDGDGWWDIAAANRTHVFVFLNLGAGSFGPGVPYDAGGNGEDNICALDANGDGIVDLTVGNQFTTNMGVLLGNGDGTFTLGFVGPTGGQPFSQACGDVDADGEADLVFANRGTNTIGVLFGDGAGGFSAPATYAVGLTPAAVDLGDLDGDGDLDIVTSNFTSGNYSIWWNRGDGVFENPMTLAGTQAGSCTTLVDYDRDGLLDIVTSDEYADVAVLFRQRPPAETAGLTGLQQAACDSVLRVDQRADLAGFAGQPPAPVRAGGRTMFGIHGPENGIAIFGFGSMLDPGLPVETYGLLHFDPLQAISMIFVMLDPHGEALLPTDVPTFLPIGTTFTAQAATATTTDISLSNPHRIVITN